MAKDSSSGLSSALSGGDDTIVARATSAGASALAVIRVSGRDTKNLTQLICPQIDTAKPWRAQRAGLRDSNGALLEESIAICYQAPKSYTGEDMLELMVHGSPWVVEAVVGTLVSAGARQAGPGEFTRRAVANGKMDLVQAEAVNDVIQAETLWQARLAREQLHGGLSQRFQALKRGLVALLAEVEGSLDYEDQGVAVDPETMTTSRDGCVDQINELLLTVEVGVRVREGARVVIVGAPNSGKSTLFNALLARERAIVTAAPGTTRDVLEAELEIEGLPVILIDTAGIREAADPAEAEGVRRALLEEKRADLVLALRAAGEPYGPENTAAEERARRMDIVSKSDLFGEPPGGEVAISCLTGEGLEDLRDEIHRRIAAPMNEMAGSVAVNNRHAEALMCAREHLLGLLDAPLEVAALEARLAMGALDEVLGALDDEEVLDAVFSTFCVGK